MLYKGLMFIGIKGIPSFTCVNVRGFQTECTPDT